MNKSRRARLDQASGYLSTAKDAIVGACEEAKANLSMAKGIVEEVRDEEQDSLDNIPENLQGSERYSAMEDAISDLEQAISAIEEADGSIDSAKG